ncbi:MAG: type II secretion system F family protein [Bdellovibrionaceae bacterium]|nr:type II secretion system F family protein [Pseudobdellovibrionaceae bacterium]
MSIVIGICVFVFFYFRVESIINFLQRRSLGQRDEVLRILRLMNSPADVKKITWIMLMMSFGLGALFFFAFWPRIIVGLLFGVSVTVAGWSLPLIVVRSLYESRCTKFVDQMVDALTIMGNGIKAGSNISQSMERVSEIMSNPIRQEFREVLTKQQFGQSLEEALTDLGTRIARPDVQMFVTAINILKETGGNLAETFATIVLVIRERQKIEKKIQAMTAQGLMQGLIVTMVPFVLAIIFYVMDPTFIKPMFNTTLGLILCFVILALQIIGGIVIRKIVTIKV